MNFANADKRRGGGVVAVHTVGGGRGYGNVFLDLSGVVVVMACEVAAMAIGACASITAINCGIAVAVGSDYPRAIDVRVTGKATIVMDYADSIAGMTGYT